MEKKKAYWRDADLYINDTKVLSLQTSIRFLETPWLS
jgi:hypothetical protein